MKVYYETGKEKVLDEKDVHEYKIDDEYYDRTESEIIKLAERLNEKRVRESFTNGEFFQEYSQERGWHWVYYMTGKFENKWLNIVLKKERIMELYGVTEL